MALEGYAAGKRDEIHTDMLLKARHVMGLTGTNLGQWGSYTPIECKSSRDEYVKNCRASWVMHFERQYYKTKRTQRLLDDRETRSGPLSLPQPLDFQAHNLYLIAY